MSKFAMLDVCLNIIDELGESASLGVTLLISGSVISGDLIHPFAYYKAEAAKLDSLVTDPNSKIASKIINEKIEEEKANPSPQDEGTERDLIYLMNPTIRQSNVSILLNNSVIALRIDAIDAFLFGKEVGCT
jgi:hypothetical protein